MADLQPPETSSFQKASYVGVPAIFILELACQHINAAFGDHTYHVGSSLERANWRDVDLVHIMPDDEFAALFPDAELRGGGWEFDPRWLLLTISLSEHLSRVSGVPVDFKFQPQTHANKLHKGRRDAIGLRFTRKNADAR